MRILFPRLFHHGFATTNSKHRGRLQGSTLKSVVIEISHIIESSYEHMLCESCEEAVKISEDRFNTKAKELHDKCKILVDVNDQKEKCGCSCNINIVPSFNVVADLQGDDADAFIEYDDRDLDEKEIESLKKSHELYKRLNK